ncbi:MAG: TlyA family RNA methyltransferase [Clostridia bacterium]|nr:TlyA family RNA methyltransferase [Clostridia bacterium]
MAERKRLDAFLFERGLSESREKAKAFIMSGIVYVNDQKALKAGMTVTEEDRVEVRGGMEFVSRGGYKLKKAMQNFPITLQDKICMDVGASTGGFTDCMLKNGAKKVFCVDVGYGQLAWKLRSDDRVVNLERTNIRYVTSEQIPDEIDFFSVDVSFISLKLVLPAVLPLLTESGQGVCLIKPQFEAGRERVGKKGVVRDMQTHIDVVREIVDFTNENGFSVLGLEFSPIKGPEGNIEYLMYVQNGCGNAQAVNAETVVRASHSQLNGGDTE